MNRAATIWEEGRTPGHRVVTLSVALTLSLAVIDLWRIDQLGVVFDIGFVFVAVLAALMVRPADMFTVGVLPPLLLMALFILLGLSRPEALTQADDSAAQAIVSSLGHHSISLFAAYVLSLGALWMRRHVLAKRNASGQEPGDVAGALTEHDRLGA